MPGGATQARSMRPRPARCSKVATTSPSASPRRASSATSELVDPVWSSQRTSRHMFTDMAVTLDPARPGRDGAVGLIAIGQQNTASGPGRPDPSCVPAGTRSSCCGRASRHGSTQPRRNLDQIRKQERLRLNDPPSSQPRPQPPGKHPERSKGNADYSQPQLA